MLGKTHVAVGVAVTAITAKTLNLNPMDPMIIFPGIIGALAADIDIDGSTITERINELIKTIIIFAVLYVFLNKYFPQTNFSKLLSFKIDNRTFVPGIILLFIFSIFSRITGHRGFSHSLLGVIAFTFSVYLIYKPFTIWFIAGYISHIIIDLLNYKGIPLFFPLKHNFQIGLCKAGGIVDKVIALVGIFIFAVSLL